MQQSTNCSGDEEEPKEVEEKKQKHYKYHKIMPELAQVIVDICKIFEKEKLEQKCIKLNRILEQTAACIGVSVGAICCITKEFKQGKELPEANMCHCNMEVPDDMVVVVHKTIFAMYWAKEHVTLDSILLK